MLSDYPLDERLFSYSLVLTSDYYPNVAMEKRRCRVLHMRKVVVVGASGCMGSAIVNELITRDAFQVVAFAHSREKLERLFGNNSSAPIVYGDVSQVNELTAAAHGLRSSSMQWVYHTPIG